MVGDATSLYAWMSISMEEAYSMTALVAQGLTKVYGQKGGVLKKVLDGLDLRVEKGEFVGIMGPSGSGKTTLLHLLSTIDQPTAGSLSIAGQDALSLSGKALARFRRERLGFIFQDFNLLDTLSLQDNIVLPLALAHMPTKEIDHRLEEISVRFGIQSVLHQYPYQVSGGQAQRAAAARALIHQPDLLLADEPTGNLDSKSAGDLLTALEQAHQDRQATLLLVTHDPFAASFCQRILLIRDGRFFAELRSPGDRSIFFQQILDGLSALGGATDAAVATRLS